MHHQFLRMDANPIFLLLRNFIERIQEVLIYFNEDAKKEDEDKKSELSKFKSEIYKFSVSDISPPSSLFTGIYGY